MKPTLYIVIPCYNEEKVLPVTAPMFLDAVEKMINKGLISDNSKIMFVNDGSSDTTWNIISGLSAQNGCFKGISLSRNRGHQNALLAGLMEVKDSCDITISIDCDGQDDLSVMEEMVKQYLDGCEIVYGVRKDRSSDTFFKRTTAQGFYRLLNIMGAEIVYNHADYRLISSKALKELAKFKEVNLFLRGMIPLVGFKSTAVYYERGARIAGESHYHLKRMLSLAFDGITSFSIRPLRMISSIGVIIAVISFIGMLWAVFSNLFGTTVAGWASTVAILCFIGSIQLVSIGIIGEYIGKIYMEVKNRPRYIISERTQDD